MKILLRIGCILLATGHVVCSVADDETSSVTLLLAQELSGRRDHTGSALEFRRLALESESNDAKGAYLWSSAHEYWRAGEHGMADRMLDRVEDLVHDVPPAVPLLRSENAFGAGQLSEAQFYFEGMMYHDLSDEEKTIVARRLSEIYLRRKDVERARATLADAPIPNPEGMKALSEYESGKDKKPWLGGVLGIIPGLGYIYAGEYANGVRSIILNGIFIYGMVDTARNDHWGAFAVITFFEFTWYSGSIYGGIDSSHRYNMQRMDAAASAVQGGASFSPEYQQLPLISLRFSF